MTGSCRRLVLCPLDALQVNTFLKHLPQGADIERDGQQVK